MKADRTPQPDCPPILGWSALAVASVVAAAWCCWSFLVEKDDQAEDVLTTDAWKPLRDQANHDCRKNAVNWRTRALKAEAERDEANRLLAKTWTAPNHCPEVWDKVLAHLRAAGLIDAHGQIAPAKGGVGEG